MAPNTFPQRVDFPQIPFGGYPASRFFSEESGYPFSSMDCLIYVLQRENPNEDDPKIMKSESEKIRLKRVLLDHHYAVSYPYSDDFPNKKDQPISVQDEEDDDDVRLKEENKWEPEKEVKAQFIIGTNPLMNPVISSFDVACIEEFYPDCSPVDKMHVVSSCGVHGFYEESCPMYLSKPLGSNFKKGSGLTMEPQLVHFHQFAEAEEKMLGKKWIGIEDKENCKPKTQARKRKASEIIHKEKKFQQKLNGANEENYIKQIMTYIEELSSKKNKEQCLTCKICKIKLSAVSTLKSHYMSHGNIKLFSCEICHSSFTRKSSLDYHLKVHNNEFRYTCSKCMKPFRHPSHYKAHLKKHMDTELVEGSDSKNEVQMVKEIKTNYTVSQDHDLKGVGMWIQNMFKAVLKEIEKGANAS